MDYLLIRRGGRGSTLVYELLWDGRGREGQPTLCGLIDVTKLTDQPSVRKPDLSDLDDKLSGPAGKFSGLNRGQIGPLSDSQNNGKPKRSKD